MDQTSAGFEALGWTLVSAGLLFLICYIVISRYMLWLDRACLQSLDEWMKSESLDLIDVQPSRNKPPWLIPLKQRAYDVSVIDATGRKLRGRAVCGRHYSSKVDCVDWTSEPDLE